MPSRAALSLIGWVHSSFGNSFLRVSVELLPAGFWLHGFAYSVNTNQAALIRKNGSSIKPVGYDTGECGENYAPEQIKPGPGIYFVRTRAEARHHCLLRVLPRDRRHCRFGAIRHRAKGNSADGMARGDTSCMCGCIAHSS